MAKSAVIIGGSNAGLMHGIMLKHHGYRVTILEQETSTSRQGYDAGLKMEADFLDFLDKHDRVKRPHIIDNAAALTVSHGGKISAQSGQTMRSTSWGLMLSILRANFDGTKSVAVPDANIGREGDGEVEFRNGARATDVKNKGSGVVVYYENISSGKTHSIAADMVIIAEGSNSSTREVFLPGNRRQYAGYMCWRGTAPEASLDPKWNELYSERMPLHVMHRSYMLAYTVPTDNGDLDPGKRIHNWIWYNNLPADSNGLAEVMTDSNGRLHYGTVPRSLVRPELWEKQKALAATSLPPGLAAILHQTRAPFVTKIFDVASPNAVFCNGKVFIVGDALFTIRPNVGLSTNQAAYHCRLMEKVVQGEMTAEAWNRAVLRYGNTQSRWAFVVTSYALGTKFELARSACSWLLYTLGQKLGIVA
ncbi:MAG: hypothetical protein Q9227_000577 [Pyrenula ochraceoflavens]